MGGIEKRVGSKEGRKEGGGQREGREEEEGDRRNQGRKG